MVILPDTIPEKVVIFTLPVTATPANASVLSLPVYLENTIHIPNDDGVLILRGKQTNVEAILPSDLNLIPGYLWIKT